MPATPPTDHLTAGSARHRPRHLLVAMPALDEEATVADVVRRIPRSIPGVARVEVLVVDDGSRDQTAALAGAAGARVISHPITRGVGAAFQTALTDSIDRGVDLLVTIDADGQFDPALIPTLIAPVLRGDADFTTASRFKDPALVPRMPRLKRWGNRVMARLISSLAGQQLADVSCGMRCLSRTAALHLNPQGRFTYTQEVILNLAFKQLRVLEVPLPVAGVRAHGRSRVASNLWRYAFRSAQIIFQCYRDYHPMRFFGGFAIFLLSLASVLAAFLLQHYVRTGAFSPHKWSGFTAAVLAGGALLFLHMGIIGDMLSRHRIYLEEILYRERERAGRSTPDGHTALPPSATNHPDPV